MEQVTNAAVARLVSVPTLFSGSGRGFLINSKILGDRLVAELGQFFSIGGGIDVDVGRDLISHGDPHLNVAMKQ